MHNRHPLEDALEFILSDKTIDNKTRSEKLKSILSAIKIISETSKTELMRVSKEANLQWNPSALKVAIPNMNAQLTESHQTALMMAVVIKDTDSMKFLLEANVDPNIPNKNGETPLTIAVEANHTDSMKVLLAAGANPDILNKNGATPLMIAASEPNEEPVNILLDAKADIHKISTVRGNTALTCACTAKNPAVERLIKEGSNITHQNKAGETALDAAISSHNYSAIYLLLRENAVIKNPRKLLNLLNSQDLKNPKIKFCYDKLCLSLTFSNTNQSGTSQIISVNKIIENIQNKIAQSDANDSGFFSSFRDVEFSKKQIKIANELIPLIQRYCNIATNPNALKQLLLLEFQITLEKFEALLAEKIKSSGEGSVNTQLLDPDVKSDSTKKGTRFHSAIYALSKEISMCSIEYTAGVEYPSQVMPASLFYQQPDRSEADCEGVEMREMKSLNNN